MQTEGIGQTGPSPASDFCHFPDCSGVELDGWPAFSESAPKHAFQTHDLPNIWSAIPPNGSADIVTPGLSSLGQLSSFEGYPLSGDTDVTDDGATTTIQDAFKVTPTPWMGDTFSYFYGSQYNPFGCAFNDNGREITIDSHSEDHVTLPDVAASPAKPSYSEIAKSTIGGSLSRKTSAACVIDEPTSECIRKSKSSTQPKTHTIRHVPFDPVPINPDSAYGLDTFATPRHVLKDRQRSQHKYGDTCVLDPYVTVQPAHGNSCTKAPSRYGLDSFDVPIRDAKHRQSSSTERDVSQVDDVNDFCRTQSFGMYDLYFGDRNLNTCMSNNIPSSTTEHVEEAETSALGGCSETTDDETCGASQKQTATLKDHKTGDNKNTAQDRQRSRSRTKPSAKTTTESADSSKQSAHNSRQSANCTKQSANGSKVSANRNKQPADSKTRESTCILNNSKPVSSTGSAFRPRSVDQINNNVRDDSKAKGKTHTNNARENGKAREKMCNNNVRDDSKMKDRTRRNLHDDSKVKEKTRSTVRDGSKPTNTTHRTTDAQDDSNVTGQTCSSGQVKTSKRTTVVESQVDYLELMEQLHDFTARAGQYVFEVFYKSIFTVLWLLLIIIKDIALLAVGLVLFVIMAGQSLVKKLLDKYCRGGQYGGYRPPPWTSSDSTHWPPGGNIELPTTGDEAVKRLLSCDEKNPYSVLGVGVDASDEDIKKFYRRQAILVHPDKNNQVGSEEAFKILQNAFDIIGDPEKREELRRTQEAEQRFSKETDATMRDVFDQIARLKKEMQEAADRLACDRCGGSHLRVATDRCIYTARYCGYCYKYHPAREGDVWAETRFAFSDIYYACMDGQVYNITEWATCQGRLSELTPNLHRVQIHLKTRRHNRTHEDDLDEFLRQFDPSTYGPSYNSHNHNYNHNAPDNTWKPRSRKQRRKRRK